MIGLVWFRDGQNNPGPISLVWVWAPIFGNMFGMLRGNKKQTQNKQLCDPRQSWFYFLGFFPTPYLETCSYRDAEGK